MKRPVSVSAARWLLLLLGVLAACASEPVFPPNVTKTVDPSMQFGIFNAEADTYLKGQTVLLGGRIVSAERRDTGILIVAQELPLQERPSRRPVDNAKPIGDFVFVYQGTVEPAGLQHANKFLLIGEMRGSETIVIDGASKAVPYLIARCLHVWKTGRYAIGDFPHLPDGYFPLSEETYCLSKNH